MAEQDFYTSAVQSVIIKATYKRRTDYELRDFRYSWLL